MRTKKALYNIIGMGLYEVVTLAGSLILPRLIISSFGSDYNGVISSVTQLLSLISILQAGASGSTRVALYRAMADKDNGRLNALLRANQIFMRKISAVYLLYVLVIACGYSFVAHTEIRWAEAALLIVIIATGTFAQYFFGITYQTLLKADQRNYVYYTFQIFATLANTVIAVVLINNRCSIYTVKLGSSVVYCLTPIFLSVYVRKRYKLNLKCEPDNSALTQRKAVMRHAVSDIVYEHAGLAALTLFCSTMLVSVFSVYMLVCNGLRKVVNVFSGGLEAGFGSIWANGEYELLKKRTRTYEFVISVLVIIIFSTALNMLIPFVRIYTKGIEDISYIHPLFAVLSVLGTAVYCIRMPYVTLVQACGKYRETKGYAGLELILAVVSLCVLVPIYGLVGVAVSILLMSICRLLCFSHYLYRKVLKISLKVFWRRQIWTATCLIFALLVQRLVIDFSQIADWIYWFASGCVSVIIVTVITAVMSVLFYRGDVVSAWAVVKRMLRGKR